MLICEPDQIFLEETDQCRQFWFFPYQEHYMLTE